MSSGDSKAQGWMRKQRLLREFRKFLDVLLATHPRPPEHVGPFEAARRDVAEREYVSRQAWEERERMWEAKRRALSRSGVL